MFDQIRVPQAPQSPAHQIAPTATPTFLVSPARDLLNLLMLPLKIHLPPPTKFPPGPPLISQLPHCFLSFCLAENTENRTKNTETDFFGTLFGS